MFLPAHNKLRPEIFARVNEKLVFHRLSYEHQLEIAEKFLSREIEFLAVRGHKLELDKTALPFLGAEKDFIRKLGARPMRDAVEKLVGDAVTGACSQVVRPAASALPMTNCMTASASTEVRPRKETDTLRPYPHPAALRPASVSGVGRKLSDHLPLGDGLRQAHSSASANASPFLLR